VFTLPHGNIQVLHQTKQGQACVSVLGMDALDTPIFRRSLHHYT